MTPDEQRAKKAAYMRDYYKTRPEAYKRAKVRIHEWQRRNKDRLNAQARAKHRADPSINRRRYEQWASDPSRVLARNLSRYRLSAEEYRALPGAGEGRCAICGTNRNLGIDHNHQTGAVRGVLCSDCNFGIGNVENSRLSRLHRQGFNERTARYLGLASIWVEDRDLPRTARVQLMLHSWMAGTHEDEIAAGANISRKGVYYHLRRHLRPMASSY